MKIQCDVCESNKATVICCADEAALCTDCDTRVHAANKLANKHQRVPLMAPTDAPRCDICQVCLSRDSVCACMLSCAWCWDEMVLVISPVWPNMHRPFSFAFLY
jgi:hypothetical protein